jgi:hypothetical protein
MVTAALSAPERLARIIDGLCAAVAAHGVRGRMTVALLLLLWGRLRRSAARVRRLAERIAAGKLATSSRPAAPRPNRPPPPRLPRGYAWLVRIVPTTAAFGSQLQHLLTDPEMAAIAELAPMRRLLRPLCQMLGLPAPPVPKRPAAQPPSPTADPFPDRRAQPPAVGQTCPPPAAVPATA